MLLIGVVFLPGEEWSEYCLSFFLFAGVWALGERHGVASCVCVEVAEAFLAR